MHTGFKLHKQAVLLEYNLNRFIRQVKDEPQTLMADITMVYEQPIQVIRKMLLEVEKDENLSSWDEWMIQMIQERYQPYEDYLLKQLDESICLSLCKDLETLNMETKYFCYQ